MLFNTICINIQFHKKSKQTGQTLMLKSVVWLPKHLCVLQQEGVYIFVALDPMHICASEAKDPKILIVCNCPPSYSKPPYPKFFLAIWGSIFFENLLWSM